MKYIMIALFSLLFFDYGHSMESKKNSEVMVEEPINMTRDQAIEILDSGIQIDGRGFWDGCNDASHGGTATSSGNGFSYWLGFAICNSAKAQP